MMPAFMNASQFAMALFIASVGSGVIGYSLPAPLNLKGDNLAWAQMVSNYGSEFLGQWIRRERISLETIGLSLLSTGVGLGVQALLSALETKMNNASGGASQSEGVEGRKEGGQPYAQVEDEAYGEGVSAGQGKAQGHEHPYMELDVYEYYDEQGRLVYRRTRRVYEDGQGNRWVHEEEWNRGMRNGLTPEPEGTPRPSWSGGQGDSREGGRSQVSASPRHGLQGSSVRELSPEGQLRIISEPEYGTLKAVEAPKYKDHMADIWSRDIPLLQKIELSAKMTVFGDDPWRWNGVPGHFQQPSTFGSELRGFGKELLNMGLTALDVVTGYSGLAPQFSISPSEINGANAAKMLPVVGIFGRASKAGGAVNAPKIEGPAPYKLGPATAQGTKNVIQQNTKMAKSFYSEYGFNKKEIVNHLRGTDLSGSIEKMTIQKGTRLQQYQFPDQKVPGNYFAPVGTPGEKLGIYTSGRTPRFFEATRDIPVLKSTTRAMIDDYSMVRYGWKIETRGGATQYFIPAKDAWRVIP